MKAAQYSRYGGPEVIEIKEVETPKAGAGRVLVEVHAAGINPFDYKVRRGYMQESMPLQLPLTIGGDFSGVVKEIGEGVAKYKPGDEVYGSAIASSGGSGSVAEFAAAKIGKIAPKPQNLTYKEAAALVLVGLSAVQALEDHIKLQNGQKILIQGGAGGIGSAAIQYAKYSDAYVAATASSKDRAFLESLGTDEIIDYQNDKFEAKLRDYDAVFDTVGGEVYRRSFAVLKKGGAIVSMTENPDDTLTSKYGVKAYYQNTQTNNETLRHLSELIEKSAIKPQIDSVFSLDQAAMAFKHLEDGHPKGKVVIEISP